MISRVCFVVPRSLVSRSNASATRKPLPLPLAKFDDFVSLVLEGR